jgi:GT2 family glycosyltransferase
VAEDAGQALGEELVALEDRDTDDHLVAGEPQILAGLLANEGHEDQSRYRAPCMISRLRSRRRPGADRRWREFLDQVEPELSAHPRVHRFAQPPLLDDQVEPDPLAVWIDGAGPAAERTRISVMSGTRPPTQILSGPLGQALAATRDQRVVLVRAGDELAPQALERIGQAARLAPDAAIITTDSDQLDASGTRSAPQLRPGPSPDHWLAWNDSGPLLTVDRVRALEQPAALDGEPSRRHELALRLAGPRSAEHAHVPQLLCHQAAQTASADLPDAEGAARVLREWEPSARLEPGAACHRVRRPVRGEASVEVIICFRDRPELLDRCVTSILALTSWDRVTVTLVDNGSIEAATNHLVSKLNRDDRVALRRDTRAFNFAALNNAAAQASTADVLVFLNNDTEIVDPQWLASLLEETTRPEVGAVAPLLLYPDGTVQHVGAAIGLHGYAGHPFAGLNPETPTPFGRAEAGTRNWLAVTAACMMVERAKFVEVGGFDESFVVAGNDVDLCLRLTAAGHRSLCVPHARLIHDESASRAGHIDPGDFAASERSYGKFRTLGDPFYNPNLTLAATDCRLRGPGE